ncbi:hypothetical protein A2U01_0034076, partial [Trifolium medium]|nr:hypothetical protein [Trifolium medium]
KLFPCVYLKLALFWCGENIASWPIICDGILLRFSVMQEIQWEWFIGDVVSEESCIVVSLN